MLPQVPAPSNQAPVHTQFLSLRQPSAALLEKHPQRKRKWHKKTEQPKHHERKGTINILKLKIYEQHNCPRVNYTRKNFVVGEAFLVFEAAFFSGKSAKVYWKHFYLFCLPNFFHPPSPSCVCWKKSICRHIQPQCHQFLNVCCSRPLHLAPICSNEANSRCLYFCTMFMHPLKKKAFFAFAIFYHNIKLIFLYATERRARRCFHAQLKISLILISVLSWNDLGSFDVSVGKLRKSESLTETSAIETDKILVFLLY